MTTTTSTTADQNLSTLTRAMLAAWAGEPLPDVDSAEYDKFAEALLAVIGQARPMDLQLLGCAAAKALLAYHQNGLQAQRATALAELKARGGLH